MTKLPAELTDAERREDEMVPVTLARAGRWRAVTLPRWVAAFIEETTYMLGKAKAEIRRERDDHFRHWWAGWLCGAGAFMTGIRVGFGLLLTAAGLVVWSWPWLKG